jgi:hypothetical protein
VLDRNSKRLSNSERYLRSLPYLEVQLRCDLSSNQNNSSKFNKVPGNPGQDVGEVRGGSDPPIPGCR